MKQRAARVGKTRMLVIALAISLGHPRLVEG